jgi:error-prone DNA polymerase
LEFFVALMNNQPMGFYPLETLKQDARRFGVPFLNPCVNRSGVRCIPHDGSVLLGLRMIRDVGNESAMLILREREERGPYAGAGDLVRRTGLKPRVLLSLVQAGAFDSMTSNRREALWDAGLAVRPGPNGQAALPLPVGGGGPPLPDFTPYERMAGEYEVMGIYPRGHLMEFVRPGLGRGVLPTTAVEAVDEGEEVLVAGWPIARQHPQGREGTVFVTIEDEEGDLQLILGPGVFARCRRQLGSRVVLVRGVVSRWDGTTNVVVSDVEGINPRVPMPAAHDWR